MGEDFYFSFSIFSMRNKWRCIGAGGVDGAQCDHHAMMMQQNAEILCKCQESFCAVVSIICGLCSGSGA
jgi:hypothetical protein